MKVITRLTAVVLLLLALTTTAVAQQKRQAPARPQPKAPAPPPTFDTLIAADTYTLYGEVRGAGQLIQSSAINEALEPILKLAGPSKNFTTVVKWLNDHADEVMTSRLLVATWPIGRDVPEAIIAIEFASAEEAAKFAIALNTFLTNVIPAPTEPASKSQNENVAGTTVSKPGYHLQQAGSLIVLSPKPLVLSKLKPAGSKLLTEDINFRAARNRFSSEPIFAFINVKLIERQEEERRKQYEAQRIAAEKQREAAAEAEKKTEEPDSAETNFTITEQVKDERQVIIGAAEEATTPDPVFESLSIIGSSFFGGASKWPDGVGLALEFENDSIAVRALFLNEPGEKSDAVPFMPMLLPGPPIIPESPNILPADTEFFATMSLDLSQIYTAMSTARPERFTYTNSGNPQTVTEAVSASPFTELEKKLKLNLKNDVLPLLGSEIALRLPVTGLNVFGLPMGRSPVPAAQDKQPPSGASPVLLISVRDKEAVRALMPKIVESFGFKGAGSFAQTERRDDTEIVSYVNLFSYAFVRNFLVLSPDPAAIKHVVDSYLKHETLGSEGHFRNSTRWQPRPAHGQLYISPALMESYKTWADQAQDVSDSARPSLTRLSAVPQPITYSLSNEGFGPLHELHIPKNLVLMAVTGISGQTNPTPLNRNQGAAMSNLYWISHMQNQYKKEKGAGSYGTLEQLIAAQLVSKEQIEQSGYRFEMIVTGETFEISAVPVEYGKTGTMSYFIDETRVLRGADRGGAPASRSDPPLH